jgi:probable F420-dependent oxidoreductase
MKVDYFLPPVSLSEVPRLASRAERLGFDGFFSVDTGHDPFLPLVTAAQATERLDLGTGIAVAFARSPMTVAYTAWDLADVSDGRFLLGLGTQIKAHITRRFGMPWGSPAARLREYIQALRAIWDTWQNHTALRFRGDFYSFTLMTPFFDPGPISDPDIPIYISAVNPLICQVAGELCQGVHVHPFHTIPYLTDVMLPEIETGAASAGRSRKDVNLAATVFVVTGKTADEIEAGALFARQQIAFYASTPAYRRVLELHGWDFGEQLTRMSKRGRWDEMASAITDEVLHEVAVVAPLDEVAQAVRARYEGILGRIAFYHGPGLAGLSDGEWSDLVAAVRA